MTRTMDSEQWNQRYREPRLIWTSEPNRFLVAEVASLPAGRALDVACGEGRNAVWLAEQGWEVTGVDFSDVGLEKARELATTRGVTARWVTADLNGYAPDPAGFDLVVVLYLHLPDRSRRSIVRMAAGALARGGTFLLVGHDASNPEHGYGGPQDPAMLYSPSDVVADLDGTGLTIERAEIVERAVETGNDPGVALDALVRARRER
jgi:SAM-dependent methyltransferase